MRYLRGGQEHVYARLNLLQAVLFGIFHQNLIQGVYAALLGFLLGYLAWRYDSLLVPIFMHFLYNLFGTVVVDLENAFLPVDDRDPDDLKRAFIGSNCDHDTFWDR